jgi:hypothetical protein
METQIVDYPICERTNCINWNNGHCTLKDPERTQDACLDYEDAMDCLRLRADAVKGTLG